ncbi:MAG: HAD hydrolase-like protein, partial [Bacteroidales bacterium]|nr:HAD hydrolase-like protein [Bacteroidales bacterium]
MITTQTCLIWDWNGTLLNDLEISIIAMNSLLKERKLPLLTEQYYKQVFDFPVKLYYEKIGFNFEQESFEEVGLEFMQRYQKLLSRATLTDHSLEVLSKIQNIGCEQFVLSSMKQSLLQKMLKDYGIHHFFKAVYGIGDDYGGGKMEIGRKLLSEQKIYSNNALLIGDTLHDAEVADEMNVSCLLFSGGHQSIQRCLSSKK